MKETNGKNRPSTCPLCQGTSEPSLELKGFTLHDCGLCRHRFLKVKDANEHVRNTYSDEYFTGGGAGYSDYLAEEDMLVERGRMYARRIAKYKDRPGAVLDVGSAAGCILKGFTEAGWNGIGLEPNESMAISGRERYGLEIVSGTLESFESKKRFELVSMIQVAAHFHDPRTAFERAHDHLAKEGLLLVETWNRNSLSARVFGRHWHEYSPPSVLQWYSSEGLNRFLESLGFETLETGRPSKRISGEHARSLLEYRIGKNPLIKLIPASVSIPYPSEDLFYGIYRKSG